MATSAPKEKEHGSPLALRPALRETDSDRYPSPRSGPAKVVSIAQSDEEIPPAPLVEEPTRPKVFTASTSGKRLTGRPTMPGGSSRASLRSQTSLDDLTLPDAAEAPTSDKKHAHSATQHHTHKHDRFVAQVTQWLEAERAKRAARREKKKTRTRGHGHAQAHAEVHEHEGATGTKPRSMSHGSDDSTTSLEKLQQILEDNIATAGHEPIAANDSSATATSTPRRPSYVHTGSKRRASLYKKLGLGSDVDKAEQEDEVTHVDVTLDNTKTMSYTGGAEDISDGTVTPGASTRMVEEKEAWATFKLEILKLTHTLHVKGWRAFPFHYSNKIEVTRLSGALTNAVYVVTPPPHQPPPEHLTRKHRKAEKVLLRIYGPQVDIDREQELGILRRLARKNIGPKMLGTFNNGRFEQFFNAQTLTPADLRDPSTSKQIAKRMRELHDGIDLLEEERSAGPLVWQHWTKWLDNVEKRMTYLDKEIMSGESGAGEHWRKRGLVAGAEWPLFRTTVEKYKEWLDKQYEAVGGVEPELVFAHNDTQYGNILRLVPESKTGESPSPLLLPQNSHRQLIVIDFEYASANTRGLEFANHFTEWCYDYTSKKSWAITTENYPTLEEQKRFVRAYVNHRPPSIPEPPTATPGTPSAAATESNTPEPGVVKSTVNTVVDTVAQLRNPLAAISNGSTSAEDKAKKESEKEEHVDRLLKEARWWRAANSAMWTIWGISQAKLPELERLVEGDDGEVEKVLHAGDGANGASSAEGVSGGDDGMRRDDVVIGNGEKMEGEPEEEEDFDYLAYSQDRARFFWGDMVGLGFLKREDLPEELRGRIKIVEN